MSSADGQDVKKSRGQKMKEGCSNFGTFLYNRETKQVMGRSGRSWAKIGVFYVIFYSCLAGFFAAMMAVFLTTVNPAPVYNEDGTALNIGENDAGPKLTQYIENSPGLTRVAAVPKAFKKDDTKANDNYKDKIDKYLQDFRTNSSKFNISLLKDCQGGDYGYAAGKPCIFIKMNKIWGWTPEEDGGDYLLLNCQTDKGEAIQTYPDGYLRSVFPYLGQKNYKYPPVAVKVDTTTKKTVQCQLQGKGIKVSDSFNPQRAFGKIEFEIGPSS